MAGHVLLLTIHNLKEEEEGKIICYTYPCCSLSQFPTSQSVSSLVTRIRLPTVTMAGMTGQSALPLARTGLQPQPHLVDISEQLEEESGLKSCRPVMVGQWKGASPCRQWGRVGPSTTQDVLVVTSLESKPTTVMGLIFKVKTEVWSLVCKCLSFNVTNDSKTN